MKASSAMLLLFVAMASAKPIMVSFGTHQGPIEPPPPPPPRALPRAGDIRNPAPVSEEVSDDLPNPFVYHAPLPHQYRHSVYERRPPPQLLLGTPLDQRNTPGLVNQEVTTAKSAVGVAFTGPHYFETQEYEILAAKKANPVKYIKEQYYQQKLEKQQKTVPQIGIIYSSGVRYYIPQLVYVEPRQEEELENSVYDSLDEKTYGKKQ